MIHTHTDNEVFGAMKKYSTYPSRNVGFTKQDGPQFCKPTCFFAGDTDIFKTYFERFSSAEAYAYVSNLPTEIH